MSTLYSTLLLFFIYISPLSGLVLSFRSKYDGYIYPYWKTKIDKSQMFYEDAVVVGEDFIVLGDGLGGTSGYSGIFSNHQCLKIADKISSMEFSNQQQLFEAVEQASASGIYDLGFNIKLGKMGDVATTLVYAKLDGKVLRTGVTGDSGYSIYRYDPTERILKLIMRSKETIYKFNSPHNVNPSSPIISDRTEHEVQEGDIVVMATDGVLDVFSSSFLTAATNYLVKKMLEKQKAGAKPEEYHLDFDYDYDMADFLEAYIQNLSQVTQQLQDSVLLEGYQSNEKTGVSKALEIAKKFIKKFKTNKQKKQKILIQGSNLKDTIDTRYPPNRLTSEMTKTIMEYIYQYEICNVFNPIDNDKIFNHVNNNPRYAHLGKINSPYHQKLNQNEPTSCFTHSKIEKKTPLHKDSPKWECETIFDLIFPLHPSATKPEDHHDFKKCVRNAIPKLPEGTTPKMIANAFNSRYFARNIALAAKFMSMDDREKAGDFLMKKYFDKSLNLFDFPEGDMPYRKSEWQAKPDDIGIAAAAVLENSKFEKENQKDIPEFNLTHYAHLNGLNTEFLLILRDFFYKKEII